MMVRFRGRFLPKLGPRFVCGLFFVRNPALRKRKAAAPVSLKLLIFLKRLRVTPFRARKSPGRCRGFLSSGLK